ncbi:MAG: DUF5915 domain-containing protein, partial [Patescibacteria group bacterium]|nr:DUF5915 domain-containing protein [Patescibacteria group bacterium]
VAQVDKVGQADKVEKVAEVEDFQVKNSVHLTSWPSFAKASKGKPVVDNRKKTTVNRQQLTDNNKLLSDMEMVRKICELGHSKRKELQIKVRQPLAKMTISSLSIEEVLPKRELSLLKLIEDELNVKKLDFIESKEGLAVELETSLTSELKAEGEARELVRKIQEARKLAGCGLSQKVKVVLPSWPKEYEEYIKKETLASKLVQGDKLEVVE